MTFRQASIAFALWALAAPAFGQDITNPTQPSSINGAYNASAPTCTDGHGCWLQTDVNGNLKVVTAGTPADVQAVSLPTTPLIASGNGVINVPTAESGGGITPVVSAALESNHVIKASAGNFYSGYITTGATAGWLLLSNSTAAPTAAGAAIAPLACVLAPANQTTSISGYGNIPIVFSTGITMVFSTSGCLTNTASTTAFFSGMAK